MAKASERGVDRETELAIVNANAAVSWGWAASEAREAVARWGQRLRACAQRLCEGAGTPQGCGPRCRVAATLSVAAETDGKALLERATAWQGARTLWPRCEEVERLNAAKDVVIDLVKDMVGAARRARGAGKRGREADPLAAAPFAGKIGAGDRSDNQVRRERSSDLIAATWNFHELGGVTKDGSSRLEAVWEAAAGILEGRGVELACIPGIRFPAAYAKEEPRAASHEGLPVDYGWLFTGFMRSDRSGVGFLHRRHVVVALRTESETRIAVIEAGRDVFIGVYVEHLGFGDAVWAARIKRISVVAVEVKRKCPGKRIWIAGDFNPGSEAHVMRLKGELAQAGFCPVSGKVPTHRAGNTLDWVFKSVVGGAKETLEAKLVLEGFAVSDHAAWTWRVSGMKGGVGMPSEEASVGWARGEEEWEEALRPAEPIFKEAAELFDSLAGKREVSVAKTKVRQSILEASEWLVDSLLVLAGHVHGRARVFQPPGQKAEHWTPARKAAMVAVRVFAQRTAGEAGEAAREAKLTELRRKYAKESWKATEEGLRQRYRRARECLAGSDGTEVDKWISRKVKPGGSLIPERIKGPDGSLLDAEESQAECIAFLQKVGRIAKEKGLMESIEATEKATNRYLDQQASPERRWERTQHPEHHGGRYTVEELEHAERRIRKSAATIRIPHEAHCAGLVYWKQARLSVLNLGRDLEVASEAIGEWLNMMFLKPDKTEVLSPESYRAVSLGHARARVHDELRMQRYEGRLMIYAGHEQRAGKEDSLITVVFKFEVVAVRLYGVGLPLVATKGDMMQGFPSARSGMLLTGGRRAQLPNRDLLQLREESKTRSGRVVCGEKASVEYRVEDGAEQGRRKCPPLYCALVRGLADTVVEVNPGVGLDVDQTVALAVRLEGFEKDFELHPDMEQAAEAAEKIREVLRERGARAIEEVRRIVRRCERGSTRLVAADLTATVRANVSQFMDDLDSFASSEGLADVTLQALDTKGRELGQIFRAGRGKTEGMAVGCKPRKQLRIHEDLVGWTKAARGLGVTIDESLTMEAHLAAMKKKSMEALGIIATAADIAGLAWDDYARVVPKRVETKACFGIELTIVNKGAERKLNAMQRQWGAAVFGIYQGGPMFAEVAGWKLLVELGWRSRLWDRTVVKAVMLEVRAKLAQWSLLHDVLRISQGVKGSWMSAVAELREEFQIPPFTAPVVEKPLSKANSSYCASRHACRAALWPSPFSSPSKPVGSHRLLRIASSRRKPLASALTESSPWALHLGLAVLFPPLSTSASPSARLCPGSQQSLLSPSPRWPAAVPRYPHWATTHVLQYPLRRPRSSSPALSPSQLTSSSAHFSSVFAP